MKKRLRVSMAIKLLIVVFTLYAAGTFIVLFNKINVQKEAKAALQQEVDKQQIVNNQLRDITEGGVDESFIESDARNKLGFGYPGEQVFIDTSSK